MEDPKERLTKCISTAVLERRWKAVREMMRDRKIDYLVIQNSEEYMGGTIRWFTDFTARWQFPMTVVFPVDDEMTTINCGGDPPADQGNRGHSGSDHRVPEEDHQAWQEGF